MVLYIHKVSSLRFSLIQMTLIRIHPGLYDCIYNKNTLYSRNFPTNTISQYYIYCHSIYKYVSSANADQFIFKFLNWKVAVSASILVGEIQWREMEREITGGFDSAISFQCWSLCTSCSENKRDGTCFSSQAKHQCLCDKGLGEKLQLAHRDETQHAHRERVQYAQREGAMLMSL